MISVTITREELTSRDACEPSIVFFEWLVDAQDRDDSVYFREWTTLHSIWLAVVRPNDAAWLRSRGLIPQLSGADLSRVNLSGANLSGADLSCAQNAQMAFAMTVILPVGDLIGWKKALRPDGKSCLIKLRIPPEAKRSNASGRKCRAEFVEVLAIDGAESAYTENYGPRTEYRVGGIVRPDSWDEDRWCECSHGIHFYITREEAEAWNV